MSVDQLHLIDMVSYDELYKILFEKFKATHDEIRYWVMLSRIRKDNLYSQNMITYLTPYQSDLPWSSNLECMPAPYIFAHERYSKPEHCFYTRKDVEKFIAPQCYRFVYLKDLTAIRNWSDYKIDEKHSKIFELLKHANEVGILRFYDPNLHEFTFTKTNTRHQMMTDAPREILWSNTFDGEAYCSNPDSFFLLFDILTVERVFFNKDYNMCLEELYGKSKQLPQNVIPMNSTNNFRNRQ